MIHLVAAGACTNCQGTEEVPSSMKYSVVAAAASRPLHNDAMQGALGHAHTQETNSHPILSDVCMDVHQFPYCQKPGHSLNQGALGVWLAHWTGLLAHQSQLHAMGGGVGWARGRAPMRGSRARRCSSCLSSSVSLKAAKRSSCLLM